MKINIIDNIGNKIDEFNLNQNIWNTKIYKQAQFDSLLSYNANNRQGMHAVKNRAQVSGGGKKPWKQKGTGKARQGSIRSPQWKGGGVVFGPNIKRNYTIKLPKKMKKLAIKSVLSSKFQNKNLIVINDLNFEIPSTKNMFKILKNLKLENNKTLIIIGINNKITTIKSGRNLYKTTIISANNINIYNLLNSNKILITIEAIKIIEEALI